MSQVALAVGGVIDNPSASFTHPADTTAYASGDLVANNTTAGSVAYPALTVASRNGASFFLRRLILKKSTIVLTLASFRVHFYMSAPTFSNGDNSAWLTTSAGYIGCMDVTSEKVFADSSIGVGIPVHGFELGWALPAGNTISWALEARAAYVPGNAEVFTVYLDNWLGS